MKKKRCRFIDGLFYRTEILLIRSILLMGAGFLILH